MKILATAARKMSRRTLVGGGLALGGFMLLGCAPSDNRDSVSAANGPKQPGRTVPEKLAMTVYRDPSCGCCEAWARIAGEAGYLVTLVDDADMAALKQRLGVPAQLASCHTAVVDEYVIEGHVPLDQVGRLLKARPSGIKGIAVPGMPIGSPGMEVPDGSTQPFQVIAFDASGGTSIYAE